MVARSVSVEADLSKDDAQSRWPTVPVLRLHICLIVNGGSCGFCPVIERSSNTNVCSHSYSRQPIASERVDAITPGARLLEKPLLNLFRPTALACPLAGEGREG